MSLCLFVPSGDRPRPRPRPRPRGRRAALGHGACGHQQCDDVTRGVADPAAAGRRGGVRRGRTP